MWDPRDRAVLRTGQRGWNLLPRRIIPAAAGARVQRFLALLRAADFTALDFFLAPRRDDVVPLFAFKPLFDVAGTLLGPAPFCFEPARRPVAMSSCRCSEPIM